MRSISKKKFVVYFLYYFVPDFGFSVINFSIAVVAKKIFFGLAVHKKFAIVHDIEMLSMT